MISSILVVALNPSIDVEWEVPRVQWEEKNTIVRERRWAGGKGINVARWLVHLGAAPRLLLPAGGRNGEELTEGLKKARLRARSIQLPGETRANVIVTTANGGQLRFNPPGPKFTRTKWVEFVSVFRKELEGVSLVVLSGSQPPGVPVSAYRELLGIAGRRGIQCVLDCDGAPFAAAIKGKPFMVKPNLFELEQWCSRKLGSSQAIVSAARNLARTTRHWVLVSLGKRGAMLLEEGRVFVVASPAVKDANTVGAGDAMTAAVARAITSGSDPAEWLRWGVACGSAAVEQQAGVLPSVKRVRELYRRVMPRLAPG